MSMLSRPIKVSLLVYLAGLLGGVELAAIPAHAGFAALVAAVQAMVGWQMLSDTYRVALRLEHLALGSVAAMIGIRIFAKPSEPETWCLVIGGIAWIVVVEHYLAVLNSVIWRIIITWNQPRMDGEDFL